MIIVRLMGGHSNQMFQYATGRSLAKAHNTTLCLDMSWFDNMEGVKTPRHYELGQYQIVETIYKRTLIDRVKAKTGGFTHYLEKTADYDPNLRNLEGNILLEGYFQTEKYFLDIRDILLQEFTLKSKPSSVNQKLLDRIKADKNATSLHVRRGDYVSNAETKSVHGVKETDYYRAALKELKKGVSKPSIYVISNDPAWCKNNLQLGVPMHVVDTNDDQSGGGEDMRLMRACKHNIMANSSFSWWGAWLNQNPNKVVITPKKWFNDTSISTADLIPESWIQV